MRYSLIYMLFALGIIFAQSAVAAEKLLDGNSISCTNAGGQPYCRDADGRPITGKVLHEQEDGGRSIENYQNGLLSGLTSVWNADGQYVSKTYYKFGRKDGVERLYYENRTIKTSAEYTDGKLDGRVDYYTEKGKLKGRLTYKDGYFEKGYCVDSNGKKRDIKAQKTQSLISCGD